MADRAEKEEVAGEDWKNKSLKKLPSFLSVTDQHQVEALLRRLIGSKMVLDISEGVGRWKTSAITAIRHGVVPRPATGMTIWQ